MAGLGLAFQPGVDQANGDRRVTPFQAAIKLLSLRLPSVTGARGIAPQALLQSPGGAGLAAGGSVEAALAWLRRLMQQSGAEAPPQARSILGRQPEARPALPPSEPGIRPRPPQVIPPPVIRPGQQAPRPWWAYPPEPPAFDYGTFDQPGYQERQQQNPSDPISPYEFQTGQRFPND